MTWGELRAAVRRQGLDVDKLIRKGAARIRDGKCHVLMIGFPIPETVEGPPARMHWLATKLPALTLLTPGGFRSTNDSGCWYVDRNRVLHDAVPIEWLCTENWSSEEFSARGKLPTTLTGQNVALIGAGSLGSVIGEILVRSGVKTVTVCDDDVLHAGNLVRHTLSLESVGINKAKALARKLNASSPHATVQAIGSGLQNDGSEPAPWLSLADLVIDCTGSDEALARLAQAEFPSRTVFVSVSLGLFARRMFVFCTRDSRFPFDRYMAAVGPWIKREQEQYAGSELAREGIGCWHPLFPARVDDVWMMAGAAIKTIEAMLALPTDTSSLSVIEQVYEGGQFTGLRLANRE